MRTLQCFFPAFAQDLCRSTILDAKLQSSDRYVVETFFSRVKEFLLVCALSATDLYAPLAARVLGRLCCRPSPRSWRLVVWRRLAGHFLGCSGNSPKFVCVCMCVCVCACVCVCVVCVVCVACVVCVVCVVCVYVCVFQQYVYNVWCFCESFLCNHVVIFTM
jgi:hypothetical protein